MPRLFIAFDIPEELRSSLAGAISWMAEYKSQVKIVPPGNYHLTLKFMGSTPDEKIGPIKDALSRAASLRKSIEARLGRWGVFPASGHAKVFLVGVEPTQPIRELAREIIEALDKIGFPPETHDFESHITLARSGSSPPPGAFLDQWKHLAAFSAAPFTLDTVTLYESMTHPSGPVYTPLASFNLRRK